MLDLKLESGKRGSFTSSNRGSWSHFKPQLGFKGAGFDRILKGPEDQN